jgi:hypothetical protein
MLYSKNENFIITQTVISNLQATAFCLPSVKEGKNFK